MIFALLVAGAYALATLRRYSVAQTATLTTFALFLSSGLTTVSGAPTRDVHPGMRDEPWIHSCGESVSSTPRHNLQKRHSLYRTLKRVQTQFRVARNHYRKERQDMDKIYSNVTAQLEKHYSMSWLPENQFEWYQTEVWCLDKAKKAEIALPKLHDTLQKFAITFHYLKDLNLDSHLNTDARTNRNRIIKDMYHEILRMLCEVETAILNLGIPMPPAHKATIVTESPNWTEKTDFTRMLVQDSGILRLYRLFLNDWVRALRNATAKEVGTCDPAKVKLQGSKTKKGKSKKNQVKKRKNSPKKRVGARRPGQGKRNPVRRRNSANGGPRRNSIGKKQKKTV